MLVLLLQQMQKELLGRRRALHSVSMLLRIVIRGGGGGSFGEASRWRKTALRHLGKQNPLVHWQNPTIVPCPRGGTLVLGILFAG